MMTLGPQGARLGISGQRGTGLTGCVRVTHHALCVAESSLVVGWCSWWGLNALDPPPPPPGPARVLATSLAV